jgi:hypothetical protein
MLGQPAWVTKLLESQKTSIDSMKDSMEIMLESQKTMETNMQTLHAEMLIGMAAIDMTAMKSTIKALGENLCIRSTNKDRMGYNKHKGFAMIVLEDGEQVGQVPAVVTKLNHCFRSTQSIIRMTNVEIDTFAKAYGKQAANIPVQGIALERAKKVFEFLTASYGA